MKRAGEVLDEATGYASGDPEQLQADELGDDVEPGSYDERALRFYEAVLKRVQAIETRVGALDRRLDSIERGLRRLNKEVYRG